MQDWSRLGCLAGFGWVADARETGKAPEPEHHLARKPPARPSDPSIEKSNELGLAL